MLRPLTLICCLLAAPVFAETSVLTIAQDRYAAGETVLFDGPAGQDLFLAGNRVSVTAPVGGSAHLAGRRVAVEAAMAGDLFAVGYSVRVTGPVGGDASVTGYEVTLGPVTGNLRAAGSEVVSGQNMGVVVGDLACAKVGYLRGGLPWTSGLRSKRPSIMGRSAPISLKAFHDRTG